MAVSRACYEKKILSLININCAKFVSYIDFIIIRLFTAEVIIICGTIFLVRRIIVLMYFLLVRSLKLNYEYDLDFFPFYIGLTN